MSPQEMAQRLKSWALDEGFDRAGVAVVRPSEHGRAFLDWLARGDQSGMAYMERRTGTRLDPGRILPGARSVLCVALQYHPLVGEAGPVGDLWPRVARYARGSDYHQVMQKRLGRLATRVMQAFPWAQARYYVDTGPVLERELGARAGLGAIGKNTNLLHPEGGSWFLLGELFLTLELAPDVGLTDLCGTCTLCLDSCPTAALPEPYRLNSRRCISYWTIEHRGTIPPEARPLLMEWVFGCDVCQEVCPVNASPLAGDHPELQLPADRAELDLPALLGLERERYIVHFRGSPMKRAGLEGLQRNAAIVMGNSRRRSYVPALIRVLREGTPLVRRHVAWALGRIGGQEATKALQAALTLEPDPAVRTEVRAALRTPATPPAGNAHPPARGLG